MIGSRRSFGYDAAASFANFIATPSIWDAFAVRSVIPTIPLTQVATNDHVLLSLLSHVIYSATGLRSEAVYRLIPALAAGATVGLSTGALVRRFGMLAHQGPGDLRPALRGGRPSMSHRLDPPPAQPTGAPTPRTGLDRGIADRSRRQREHPDRRIHAARPARPAFLSDLPERRRLVPAWRACAAAARPVALERGPRPVAAVETALVVGVVGSACGDGPGPVARAPARLPLPALLPVPPAPLRVPDGGRDRTGGGPRPRRRTRR